MGSEPESALELPVKSQAQRLQRETFSRGPSWVSCPDFWPTALRVVVFCYDSLRNEYRPLVADSDQWEKMAVCCLKGSHAREKWAQKRTAMDAGLMEGATQKWDLAASVGSEGERRREAPSVDRGMSSTQRVPVLEPRRASGDLKWPCWAGRAGYVTGEQSSYAGKIPKFTSVLGNQYPSSKNMINDCTSSLHFHPITYFLHVWKAIESKLAM